MGRLFCAPVNRRAPANRTLRCSADEVRTFSELLLQPSGDYLLKDIEGRLIQGDFLEISGWLPKNSVDLLILDPPYNLSRNYHGRWFRARSEEQYTTWFETILQQVIPLLRPAATVYVCSDWRTSTLVFPLLEKALKVRNRITWEREKGRGSRRNWKNNTEDIWFCTVGDDYTFNPDAVKLKRRVRAPYRDRAGSPRDWQDHSEGPFRLTYSSNLWSDITVPFWSMPENTDHPTQKPEKLLAKLLLASSNQGDFVFDPFLGSGTTAVVAKKLGRRFSGVEINPEYGAWALKRLQLAEKDKRIQGFEDGVFWERNSRP